MMPSKRRSPGVATNNARDTKEEKHSQYTAFLREIAACVVLGVFIGVIVGSAILGMLDNQRLAATKMKQAASMAGVVR